MNDSDVHENDRILVMCQETSSNIDASSNAGAGTIDSAGVKKIEAVTLCWSRKELKVAYLWYVASNIRPRH